ncbi:Derepression protein [Candidatus Fukatsuia endosymbiont of Tuberolachnus salignus]|uniref:Derepression protein n=1 Tax=Candidatus Fukatsuia endosymbiont of Tuberolachnus salignus TaxID=3077957 RepID=UPI00313D4473
MKNVQMSIESYHKLNRSKDLLAFLHVHLIHQEVNGIYRFFIPHLFNYITDDISYVLNELKDKGLYEDFLKK